jgi:preprotein translocase subunit SecA
VEEQNFVARKNVLKYDDVMNVQRQVIYEQRRAVLEGQDLSEELKEIWLPEVISNVAEEYTSAELTEDWDLDGLVAAMENLYGTGVAVEELRGLDREAIVDEFMEDANDAYKEREAEIEGMNEGLMRDLERFIVLQVVDVRWREHLESMDYMREGIHLRGMAQKDPLVEYRNEGHLMFQDLNRAIREEVISLLFHAQIEPVEEPGGAPSDGRGALTPSPAPNGRGRNGNLTYEHQSFAGAEAIAAAGGVAGSVGTPVGGGSGSVATRPVVKSEQESIGRNDPCWCGSGKKYKKCHGA